MEFPKQIQQRIERLHSYHQRSKIMAMGARVAPPVDPAYQPAAFRKFDDRPAVALPAALLDASIDTLKVLSVGQDALADGSRFGPQDLHTLASWLSYAVGETQRTTGRATTHTRPFSQADAIQPFEIYVAAFAIDGLEAGLYHFCPRQFCLSKLRDGIATLMQIKKGRPDLEFIKGLPAAIIVSSNYWRSVWRYQRRGYRSMLVDTGLAVQNLIAAGAALGAQTITRLRMNDSTMRELIGIKTDEPLGSIESVQAMILWADPARNPMLIPPGAQSEDMPPILRRSLSAKVVLDSAARDCMGANVDCISPGVMIRELRPPLTELSPLPANHAKTAVEKIDQYVAALPVRQVMMDRRARTALTTTPISQTQLLTINRVTMRSGSFFPMFPDGPHLACVRAFWVVQDVTGMQTGIWYHHPQSDQWSLLRSGAYRREMKYVAGDRQVFGNAPAVCIMVANLNILLTKGGPDVYRLAHLEAGIAGQRAYLSALSLGLSCVGGQDYYDEDARAFLGLEKTGWEVLYMAAIGHATT